MRQTSVSLSAVLSQKASFWLNAADRLAPAAFHSAPAGVAALPPVRRRRRRGRWRWRHNGASAYWRAASPAAGKRSGVGIWPARARRKALGIIPSVVKENTTLNKHPARWSRMPLSGHRSTRGEGKHHVKQTPGRWSRMPPGIFLLGAKCSRARLLCCYRGSQIECGRQA